MENGHMDAATLAINTENKKSSYWQPFRHWLYLTLSERQPRVQPVTRRLSIWRPFGFNEYQSVQSQNPVSPNGPPTVDGWVVRITFGWSAYAVVRNDKKILIWLLCYLFSTITKAYIIRSRQVSEARHFCLKFSNRFEIWQAALLSKRMGYFFQTTHGC